jgi:hypothetical protein
VGGPPALGFGEGLTTSHHKRRKKTSCYDMFRRVSEFDAHFETT